MGSAAGPLVSRCGGDDVDDDVASTVTGTPAAAASRTVSALTAGDERPDVEALPPKSETSSSLLSSSERRLRRARDVRLLPVHNDTKKSAE